MLSLTSVVLISLSWVGAVAAESGTASPWPPQYKIRPDQTDRLTAADVVGPDGIVYPNWTRCGVQGGMNENWLILHNRFVVDSGPGVYAKTVSFDHIIRENVFVLKDGKSPMIQLATADCTGVEAIGNRLYGGNGRILAGQGQPALSEANQALPLSEAPRPEPSVPSIYEWQRRHAQGN
jgi:hypothetical protein